MKAIMVMFDTLNRRALDPYGGTIPTPNFNRLAHRSVTFQNAYVGSMPCMPARRELHTGRYNFLHKGWGPLEPFDESMPRILRENSVHSHLVSDHYHYWEEGGANYHTKYRTWEVVRGQEGDPWKGVVHPKPPPENLNDWERDEWRMQDWINRPYCRGEAHPQAVTFAKGLEFIETNRTADRWFLTIETFDPHEPFFCDEEAEAQLEDDYNGPQFDWPLYGKMDYSASAADHCRKQNARLVTMCDRMLGEVLDAMDRYDLWKDTMLIVNTDHGFLLGDRELWGKVRMPWYNEMAHIPFFIWDPRSGRKNEKRDALVQTIDIAPTLLEFFGCDIPESMQGRSLTQAVAEDIPVREACLFGQHGAHVNCTDGRYVYMRAAPGENRPLFDYTLNAAGVKKVDHKPFRDAELVDGFGFMNGCNVMKVPSTGFCPTELIDFNTKLFDLETDPEQKHPVENAELEEKMKKTLIQLMKESDAPAEQYERLGL